MESVLKNTPILSIYDMMMDRQRAAIRENQKKAMYRGALGLRKMMEEKAAVAEAKKIPGMPKVDKGKLGPMKVWSPYCETPRSGITLPPNTITASHLTKKQLSVKVQQPGKKEVITQLVERMSQGSPQSCISPRMVKKTSSKSKQQAISRRKNKKNKSNVMPDGAKRLPLSPRKAERPTKGTGSPCKILRTPKSSPTNTLQKVFQSGVSSTNVQVFSPPPTGRWRI
ncbi:hypothetical protein KR026_002428 [Drosophila bipectinata]|nr:hypothetical protein KR026_002428 [Drosophila bipectinata]